MSVTKMAAKEPRIHRRLMAVQRHAERDTGEAVHVQMFVQTLATVPRMTARATIIRSQSKHLARVATTRGASAHINVVTQSIAVPPTAAKGSMGNALMGTFSGVFVKTRKQEMAWSES
jgi:hypothetical protein